MVLPINGGSYGYSGQNPYAAQNASVYQHMGGPMEGQGYGGYNPYLDTRPYRGGYSSNGAIDIHIPLPHPQKASTGKKGKASPASVPTSNGDGAGDEGDGSGAVAGGTALVAGKKSRKKAKRKAAAAAAALSATSGNAPATGVDGSAAANGGSTAAATSVTSSIPFIAPSSYAGRGPVTAGPAIQSVGAFPPISASTHSSTLIPSAPSTPVSAASSPTSASKPPTLLNYASHVGSLSPGEVAKVAAAAKAVRDAKQRTEKPGDKDGQDRPQKETTDEDAATQNAEVTRKEATATVPSSEQQGSRGPAPREGGVWVKREGGGGPSSSSWRERQQVYRRVIHAPHPQRYSGYQGRSANGAASPSPTSSTSAGSGHSTSSSPSSPSSTASRGSQGTPEVAGGKKVGVSYAELIKRTASASPHGGKSALGGGAAAVSGTVELSPAV